jgi:hypothetical protein
LTNLKGQGGRFRDPSGHRGIHIDRYRRDLARFDQRLARRRGQHDGLGLRPHGGEQLVQHLRFGKLRCRLLFELRLL